MARQEKQANFALLVYISINCLIDELENTSRIVENWQTWLWLYCRLWQLGCCEWFPYYSGVRWHRYKCMYTVSRKKRLFVFNWFGFWGTDFRLGALTVHRHASGPNRQARDILKRWTRNGGSCSPAWGWFLSLFLMNRETDTGHIYIRQVED